METEYKQWKDDQLGKLASDWFLQIDDKTIIERLLDHAYLYGRIVQCERQTNALPKAFESAIGDVSNG